MVGDAALWADQRENSVLVWVEAGGIGDGDGQAGSEETRLEG